MSNWKQSKFRNIAQVKYGKAHQALADGKVPAYGSGGLMRFVEKALYDEESILIPRKGTLNNIIYKAEPFWTVDTMFYTILDKNQVSPKFIFYQLSMIDFANMNVGSAVPSMTVSVLDDLDILLPPLSEQKAIAEVLSSLDDKIDLLHRQNKTLEQLAETLFRQWFVEEADESWDVGVLDDEFDFIMGQSPSGDTLNEEKKGMIFFQGRSDFRFRFPEPRIYTTEPKRIAQPLDTLVSVRAPVGDMNMAIEECCLGRGVAAFRYRENKSFYSYTYYKMRSLMESIKQFEDNGSVFGSIGKDDFKKLENVLPSGELIVRFQNEVKSLDEKIIANEKQMQTLTKLRESLLPKLMSGDLKIN
jgi:type I restriction enzyme, S subunit